MDFLEALISKDEQEIRKLIDKNEEFVYLKAAYDGNLYKLQNININDLKKVCDDEFRTALHYAAAGGQVKVIDYLVSVGFNVRSNDTSGKFPIDYAIKKNHLDAIVKLQDAASVAKTDDKPIIKAQEILKPSAAEIVMDGFVIKEDYQPKSPMAQSIPIPRLFADEELADDLYEENYKRFASSRNVDSVTLSAPIQRDYPTSLRASDIKAVMPPARAVESAIPLTNSYEDYKHDNLLAEDEELKAGILASLCDDDEKFQRVVEESLGVHAKRLRDDKQSVVSKPSGFSK